VYVPGINVVIGSHWQLPRPRYYIYGSIADRRVDSDEVVLSMYPKLKLVVDVQVVKLSQSEHVKERVRASSHTY
jgi:hypothetical protein